MRKTILFATGNQNKVKEVNHLLGDLFILKSLKDINYTHEIEETGVTLEENAVIKAKVIYDLYNKPTLSEDTGLEISSLNNEPGVFSARYAGAQKDANDNMNLVLSKLKDAKDRSARFRTVVAYIDNETTHLFEGIINGSIAFKKSGDSGFGYDPIFIPEGYSESFATLGANVKKEISHRSIAIKKWTDFMQKLYK